MRGLAASAGKEGVPVLSVPARQSATIRQRGGGSAVRGLLWPGVVCRELPDGKGRPMSATERLGSEQAFHDRQARQRAAAFAGDPERLRFADDAYLDHETWIRPALARLGDVRGRRVLD